MSIELKQYKKKYVHVKDVYIIREEEAQYVPHTKLNYPAKTALYLHKVFDNLADEKEHFVSVSLNMKNELIAVNVISIGSLNACIVHPREVFYAAIVDLAASIILCHNHPSGSIDPSQNDIDLTRKLTETGRIIGIDVLDHLILGDEWKFYSMKEHNML